MYCSYCFLIGCLYWSKEKGLYVKKWVFTYCSIYSLFHFGNIYLEHNRAISFWTWTSFVKSEISMKSEISNFLTKSLIFGWGKCRYTTIWVCFLWLLYYFFTFIPAHFVCLLWIEVPQRSTFKTLKLNNFTEIIKFIILTLV